jgi:hypothetical protein
LLVILFIPIDNDATLSISYKNDFNVGFTKNIKCEFFLRILSPKIVKKYLASFLDTKKEGYNELSTF